MFWISFLHRGRDIFFSPHMKYGWQYWNLLPINHWYSELQKIPANFGIGPHNDDSTENINSHFKKSKKKTLATTRTCPWGPRDSCPGHAWFPENLDVLTKASFVKMSSISIYLFLAAHSALGNSWVFYIFFVILQFPLWDSSLWTPGMWTPKRRGVSYT